MNLARRFLRDAGLALVALSRPRHRDGCRCCGRDDVRLRPFTMVGPFCWGCIDRDLTLDPKPRNC